MLDRDRTGQTMLATAEVVPLLDELLAGAAEAPAGPACTGSYRRAEMNDAVNADEDLVLLHGERLSVHSGIGPALWHAARDWRGSGELKDAVVREFGDHPEADAPLAEHLEALAERGVLTMNS